MKTHISSRGRFVLPAELRRRDDIAPRQEFEIDRLALGVYRLVRRQRLPNRGLIDWLLGCPEKGFFVPIATQLTQGLASTHVPATSTSCCGPESKSGELA